MRVGIMHLAGFGYVGGGGRREGTSLANLQSNLITTHSHFTSAYCQFAEPFGRLATQRRS